MASSTAGTEPPAGVTLRAGLRPDGAAIARLWAEADELDEAVVAEDLVLDHLFARASVVVAEETGVVVGFAGTIRIGAITHLTDLFVAGNRHGRGIGRALLGAALGDAAERTTFSSAHPHALPAYVRAGMRPWWPLLYLEAGVDALRRIGPGGADAEILPLDAGGAGAAGLDLGDTDRGPDYAEWSRRPGALLFELRVARRRAAVGAAAERLRGGGADLLRLVIGGIGDPAAATLAAIAAVGDRFGAVALTIPGPHPAVPPLLEAGARLTDRDTFMATHPDLVDPERLLPHPAYL